jgi:hypothetical protein
MVQFIDDHRTAYGVEPICRVLPIAPSTYFRHKAQQADPRRCSARPGGCRPQSHHSPLGVSPWLRSPLYVVVVAATPLESHVPDE